MREWARACEPLAGEPGIAMIIGAPSAGKTTFTSFLANCCHQAGVRTAIVDADVGQSDIGPPGTIGLGVVEAPLKRMGDAALLSAYFVGFNSPDGHVHYVVAGVRKMVDRARAAGARAILVDTTGLVQGYFGRHLKQAKFDAIEPQYVIGVQRSSEIEHILGLFERCGRARVIRVPASPKARARSQDERRLFREAAYRRHFAPAVSVRAPFDRLSFLRTSFGSGRRVDEQGLREISTMLGAEALYGEAVEGGLYVAGRWVKRPDPENLAGAPGVKEVHLVPENAFRNLLVGLLDSKGEFLAEGVISEVDFRYRTVTVVSRLSEDEFSRVAAVVFGSLRVTPEGRELGRVFPGEL